MSDIKSIEVIREDGISSLIKLKITDTLPEIRERLEQDSTIGMDDTLLFLDSESFEISRKKEADYRLKDLITNNDTIYLRNHKCSINYIKCKLKLEYGRILNPDNSKIIIADKKAFVIRDIESTDPEETSCDDEIRIISKESWENKINLFFNAGAEMMNFGSTRINFSIMQSESQQVEKTYSCKYTKVPKMVLKFEKIEPTEEFVNYVKDAIKSNNREKFKEIYGKFGQFVPKKVTLGGIVYDVTEGESNEYSEQKNFGINPKIDAHAIPGANIQAESGFNLDRSNKKSTSEEKKRRNLLGGEPQDLENFDKKEWIGSLSDHKTWKCIEFQNPINIFQLLDDSLRKEVYEFFGKKVLYSDVMKFDRQLDYGERVIIPLPLQGKICKTIENEDAKCNVFATIVCDDKKKNDFFNYQIYHPKDVKDVKPQLIIHCYQRKQKSQTHNLKIGFMIIGYDVDFNNSILNDDGIKFDVHDKVYLNSNNQNDQNLAHEFGFDFNFDDVNSFLGIPVLSESNNSILVGHYFFKKENKIAAMLFSYNLNKNKYVKLPNLRFQVLTISGHPTCGKISFKKRFMRWRKYIDIEDIEKCWTEKYIPKYISVYSENCGPVFLKQKKKEIKLKHTDCKCKGACPFCKNRSSERNVKCTYFVSNTK